MDTTSRRQLTEEEFYFADKAFGEFREHGQTDKKCPWCSGDFEFDDQVSGYTIACKKCDFKVTVRGI